MQTHLCADMLACLPQEVRRSHPELERTKRMLHGLTAYAHHLWMMVESLLHCFDYALMLPALYPAGLLPGCALLSDCAGRTCRTRVAMQSHTVLDVCETPGESLLRWATVLIIFGNVDEVLLAEVPICFTAR